MNKSLQYSFKYLAVYISASLDIDSALELVCKRLKYKKLLHIFRQIQSNIQSGKNIKDSFAILKEKKLLDGVSWSILTSAEYGGNIKDAFFAISKNIEERAKTKSSLIGALAYPIGMCIASLGMVIFLVTVAFPKIVPLFKSMNAPIPTTTRYILKLSMFISEWGVYFLIVGVSLAGAGIYLYIKEQKFKYTTQSCLLKIPLFSNVILYREYASIASSIEVLLRNHKTLSDALLVVRDSMYFEPLKSDLSDIFQRIQVGQKVSSSFEQATRFSTEWVDLIAVGEMTGSLPESFKDIGTLHKIRYTDVVQMLVRVSEPVALLATAIVVLVIALSVITPMYSIIQQVQGQ